MEEDRDPRGECSSRVVGDPSGDFLLDAEKDVGEIISEDAAEEGNVSVLVSVVSASVEEAVG